ncbi:MAG: M28 family peptidase, partial [Phycisphaerales bacterium]|nr:M28 family peptidase [Phycisphaerales bacterium]
GRAPGSAGMERAADYVEFWYRHAGLDPAFPEPGAASHDAPWTSYRQPMELPGRGVDIKMAEATFGGGQLEPGRDFIVLGCSGKGAVEAPITFVGYGIAEGQDGYTSFDGDERLDGRIAMLLRYEPMNEEGQSLWSDRRFSQFAAILPKLQELAKRGAVGVVLVNPPDSKFGRRGLDTTEGTQFGGSFDIPMIQVSQETAESMLHEASRGSGAADKSLLDWRRLADTAAVKTVKLADGAKLRMGADVSPQVTHTENIGAVLRGSGLLKDQWIVIGGHYDHVGFGYFGTDPRNRGQLHPGADDNASGTAAVLVLADRLAKEYKATPEGESRRSILFLSFTAEESGLEGSRHFVKNPTIPAEDIDLMINLDMVGRLRNDTLSLGGIGTAADFQAILQPEIDASGLTVALDPSGRGPSDHSSFYGAGMPVLFAFTGMHAEYHSPRDTADTVNPAGAAKVIRLIEDIALATAAAPQRLVFQSSDSGPGTDRGYAPVRLGITPGMGAPEGGAGVVVEAVSEGTSAAEAGVQAGDVLISWNGEELTGTGSLMENLRKHKPGDIVQLVLLRNGQRVVVTPTLKESTGRRGG